MQPWHQKQDESSDAFVAFSAYLDQLPPRRGLLVSLSGMPVSPALLVDWYSRHQWQERAAAWDARLSEIRDAERETLLRQTIREIDAEHMSALATLREVTVREALKLLEDSKASTNAKLAPRDLIRFLESVVKCDRLIRGQATERVTQVLDMSTLSDEDLAMAEAILAKAEKKV